MSHSPPSQNEESTAKGKILIMDDEEMIRIISSSMVEFLGYTPITCKDGKEAIRLYQEALAQGNPPLAVILDLNIPKGVGGEEAARQLMQIHPTAKIIVSSGYTSDPVVSNFRKYGFTASICKPYVYEDIKDLLQQVLSD